MKLKLLNKTGYNKANIRNKRRDFLPTGLEATSTELASSSSGTEVTKDNVASLLSSSEWARSTGLLVFSESGQSNAACVALGTNPNGSIVEERYKLIDLDGSSNQEVVDLEFSSDYFDRSKRNVKRVSNDRELQNYRGSGKMFVVSRQLTMDSLKNKLLNKLNLTDIPRSSALVMSVGTQRQPETAGKSVMLVDCNPGEGSGLDFLSLLDPKIFVDDNRALKGGEFSECSLLKLYSYNDAKDLLASVSISTNRTVEHVFPQLLGVDRLTERSNSSEIETDARMGCLILTSPSSYLAKLLIGRVEDLNDFHRIAFQMADDVREVPFYAVYPSTSDEQVFPNDSVITSQLLRLAIEEDNATSRIQKTLRLHTNFRILFGDAIGVYTTTDIVPNKGKSEVDSSHPDVLYRQKGELLAYARRIKERYSIANEGEVYGLKSSLYAAIRESDREFRSKLPVQTPFSVFNNKTGYTYCAIAATDLQKATGTYLIVGSDSVMGYMPLYPLLSYGRRTVTRVTKIASSHALEATGLVAINNVDNLKALRSEDTQGHGLSGVGSFRVVFSDRSGSGSAYYLGSVILGAKGYYFKTALDSSLSQVHEEIGDETRHIPIFVDEAGVLDGELRVYTYYLHTNLVMQAVLCAMDSIGVPAYVDKYSWDIEELRSKFGSATVLRALYGTSKVPEFKPISKGYISAGLVRELGAFNNIIGNTNFGTLIGYSDGYRKLGKLVEALVDRRLLRSANSEVFQYKDAVFKSVPAIPLRDLLLAQETAETGVIDCETCQPFNNCLIFD